MIPTAPFTALEAGIRSRRPPCQPPSPRTHGGWGAGRGAHSIGLEQAGRRAPADPAAL
jgi:hypothetical protein